jgi:predicted secreted protein
MASIKGDTITITIGGTEYTAQLDCNYTETSDMLECTTKDSNGFKEFLRGDGGWKITFNGYTDTTNFALLFGSGSGIKKGTVGNFQIGPVGSQYFGGDGWVSNLTLDAPKNGVTGFSVEVTGTGVPFYDTLMST